MALTYNGGPETPPWESLDPEIRPAVEIMHKHGFDVFESCQGGEGHCCSEPMINFRGNEMDCIRAYDICWMEGLRVFHVYRVFAKNPVYDNGVLEPLKAGNEIGWTWIQPFNKIIFLKHPETGSIFRTNPV